MMRFWLLILVMCLGACTQSTPAEVVMNAAPKSSSKQFFDSKNPFKVTVKAGDTIYTLAQEYAVETRDIIDLNRLRPPYDIAAGDMLKLPKPRFHEVSKGDTVFSIAKVYNISVSSMVRVNHLNPPYVIKTGQKLRLPSRVENEDNSLVAGSTPEARAAFSDTPDASYTPSGSGVMSRELAPIGGTNARSAPASNDSGAEKISLANSPWENTANSTASAAPSASASAQDSPFAPPQSQAKRTGAFPTPTLKNKPAAPQALASKPDEASTPAASGKSFSWPVKGKVVSHFGPKQGGAFNDGITIAAPEGTTVKAPKEGVVAYAGNELKGYGNLVLIRHPDGFVTSYAHLKDRALKVGDPVKPGQTIGRVGKTGNVPSPQLHFSIRKGKKAVNPEEFL